MMYKVTIYSPADEQEHVFNTKTPMTVAERLAAEMEPGAWFKIERIS